MKIRKATENNKKESLKIAKNLKEWFSDEGLKNMKTDFNYNTLIVAVDENKTLGFLCYTTISGVIKILWIGVERSHQRKGIGKNLLKYIEKEGKKNEMKKIEVETLPEEYDHKPYELTRNFYYKNGFKRVEYKKARIKGWDDQIILEKDIK
jgi:GNAT superfamily N-acetyltransferase